MLRFASLASGSGGNCLVADADGTRVLVDCGLNLRDVEKRLLRLGLVPAVISTAPGVSPCSKIHSGVLSMARLRSSISEEPV